MFTVKSVFIQNRFQKFIVGRDAIASGRRQRKCVRVRVRYEDLEERLNTWSELIIYIYIFVTQNQLPNFDFEQTHRCRRAAVNPMSTRRRVKQNLTTKRLKIWWNELFCEFSIQNRFQKLALARIAVSHAISVEVRSPTINKEDRNKKWYRLKIKNNKIVITSNVMRGVFSGTNKREERERVLPVGSGNGVATLTRRLLSWWFQDKS